MAAAGEYYQLYGGAKTMFSLVSVNVVSRADRGDTRSCHTQLLTGPVRLPESTGLSPGHFSHTSQDVVANLYVALSGAEVLMTCKQLNGAHIGTPLTKGGNPSSSATVTGCTRYASGTIDAAECLTELVGSKAMEFLRVEQGLGASGVGNASQTIKFKLMTDVGA